MKVATVSELPRLDSMKSSQVGRRRELMPFANVMKSLDLEGQKRRDEEYRARRRSQEIFVPGGLKSYTEDKLQELTIRSRFKKEEYQQRYMTIYKKNPHAFYKHTGEFTLYSDCSVKINRVGPYNKKK